MSIFGYIDSKNLSSNFGNNFRTPSVPFYINSFNECRAARVGRFTLMSVVGAPLQILPLENNMKTPKSFGGTFGVLNFAMLLIIIMYVAMGFLGYMKYGSGALGSITLNLPKDEM